MLRRKFLNVKIGGGLGVASCEDKVRRGVGKSLERSKDTLGASSPSPPREPQGTMAMGSPRV